MEPLQPGARRHCWHQPNIKVRRFRRPRPVRESIPVYSPAFPARNLMLSDWLKIMMDEIARKLIVYQDKKFVMLLTSLRADDDALADAASVLWMRSLYPGWAMEGALPHAAELLRNWPAATPKRPSRN